MYNYHTEKPKIFTEEGQVQFLKIRDNVKSLLETAGAFQMQNAIHGCTGDSWTMLACVDRLVDLGEIREVPTSGAGQYRVFVKSNSNW